MSEIICYKSVYAQIISGVSATESGMFDFLNDNGLPISTTC